LLRRALLLCSTSPVGCLLIQGSLPVSLPFSLVHTLLLRRTTLLGGASLGGLPFGGALSLDSLSALIAALLLLRSATLLLLQSLPAGGSLISARRGRRARLWRTSGRVLRCGHSRRRRSYLRRRRAWSWRTGVLGSSSGRGSGPGVSAARFSALWTLSCDKARACHQYEGRQYTVFQHGRLRAHRFGDGTRVRVAGSSCRPRRGSYTQPGRGSAAFFGCTSQMHPGTSSFEQFLNAVERLREKGVILTAVNSNANNPKVDCRLR